MSSDHLGLSIRFLNTVFHGRRDGRLPEWPPSPLRAFQALVAAAAARARRDGLAPDVRMALAWLERQSPPVVIAPLAITGAGYRLSVPNNQMDIVAGAWCRGNDSNTGDANPATHRTMKTVQSMWLRSGDAVHYLWRLPEPISDEVRGHCVRIAESARSVVALGWGIDLAIGTATIVTAEELSSLAGEQWLPRGAAARAGLRVPVNGTLEALIHRYGRFLERIGPHGFDPPPPLTSYASVEYRRAVDVRFRPVAAFSTLRLDASAMRSFDTPRRALTVAGMLRHATRVAAEHAGWPEQMINGFVLGHAEVAEKSEPAAVGPTRFAYLPIPSIEHRGLGRARAGAVRRCILTCFSEDGDVEVAWARRTLSGQELVNARSAEPTALLSLLPENEKTIRRYRGPASTWSTVTPVVLPGYDDPAHYRRRLERGVAPEEQKRLLAQLDARVEGLLRKAIVQAGFPRILAEYAAIEWRETGFMPGTDLVWRYGVPDHLRRFPRLHVRLRWRDASLNGVAVPGPICIGGGRYYGIGLFVAESTTPST
jgi:CRISPR-associated protein Csb2